MPFIGLAGQAASADPMPFSPFGGLEELEEVPPDGLLRPWIVALHRHVGPCPEAPADALESMSHRAVEG